MFHYITACLQVKSLTVYLCSKNIVKSIVYNRFILNIYLFRSECITICTNIRLTTYDVIRMRLLKCLTTLLYLFFKTSTTLQALHPPRNVQHPCCTTAGRSKFNNSLSYSLAPNSITRVSRGYYPPPSVSRGIPPPPLACLLIHAAISRCNYVTNPIVCCHWNSPVCLVSLLGSLFICTS